jgi:hypothetical protein
MRRTTFGAIAFALAFSGLTPASAQNDRMRAMKTWKDCVARVRQNYQIPPGNMNELNALIQQQCGPRPS